MTWILVPFFKEAARRHVSRSSITFSAFCIMLRTSIEQFVGFWVSESGYRLRIRKVRKDQAVVDFLDQRGAPSRAPIWEEPLRRIWITSTISLWTPSSAKRLNQPSVDTSGTVFWMRITHCLALWITLFEQPTNRGTTAAGNLTRAPFVN